MIADGNPVAEECEVPETRRYRSFPFIAAAVVAAAVILFVACGSHYVITRVRIALAEEQTTLFDEMRLEAARAEPREAVEFLRYALNYYPSGTKQVAGSKLDQIVERARASAVREIIADLRRRTGRDYGEDPQRWIDELIEGSG